MIGSMHSHVEDPSYYPVVIKKKFWTVYDKQGHIITNNHAIDGASTADVTFVDGNTYRAVAKGVVLLPILSSLFVF
jgi:hypothetical protein